MKDKSPTDGQSNLKYDLSLYFEIFSCYLNLKINLYVEYLVIIDYIMRLIAHVS